jgi:hypothetical protein
MRRAGARRGGMLFDTADIDPAIRVPSTPRGREYIRR